MDTSALGIRVDRLERDLAQEITKREQSDKYRHNMAEDIQLRYSEIKSDINGIKIGLLAHIEDDKTMRVLMTAVDNRLKAVERLVWVAAGGVIVLGGLVGIVGTNILRLLTKT